MEKLDNLEKEKKNNDSNFESNNKNLQIEKSEINGIDDKGISLKRTLYDSKAQNEEELSLNDTQNNKISKIIFDSEDKKENLEKTQNLTKNFSSSDTEQKKKKIINPYRKQESNDDKEKNTDLNLITTNFKNNLKDSSIFPKENKSKSSIDNSNQSPLFFCENQIGKFIINALKDQASTKNIQSLITDKNTSKENISKIVDELEGTFSFIIKNKNGNYFVKDLIMNCQKSDRLKILKELSKTFSDDCTDKYATFPLQAMIDFSNCEEEFNLILDSFNDYNKTLLASLDPNGSFVIRKIITHIPDKFKKNFNTLFITFLSFIITKKYGVVNAKCFAKYTKDEEILLEIDIIISKNFLSIATNEFGKYFIEHLLQIWGNTREGEQIKQFIIKNFKNLFYDKKTSYICKNFLMYANQNYKNELLNNIHLGEKDIAIKLEIMKSFENNFRNNNNTKKNNYINTNQNQNINQFPRSLNNYNNNNYQNINYFNNNIPNINYINNNFPNNNFTNNNFTNNHYFNNNNFPNNYSNQFTQFKK